MLVKQVVLRGGSLEVVDVPAPSPEPGRVLVANLASVISSGTERASVEQGGGGGEPPSSPPFASGWPASSWPASGSPASPDPASLGEQNAFRQSAGWAEICGGLGIRVEKPGDLPGAVRDVLAAPGPALLDVVVNPDEPPMPPSVNYEQAKGFAASFLKGQPRRATIAATLFRDKVDQLKS